MDRKYNEVMEHIEVTPEMRERILAHIKTADLSKQKVIFFPHWRQITTLAACLVLVLIGALTVSHLLSPTQQPTDPVDLKPFGVTELPDVQTLSVALGFEVTDLTELPFEVERTTYSAFGKELAQIDYAGQGQIAIYRKARGNSNISGDHTAYGQEITIEVDSYVATLKGNDDVYSLATWTDNEFAYSLWLSEGVSKDKWNRIFLGIIKKN